MFWRIKFSNGEKLWATYKRGYWYPCSNFLNAVIGRTSPSLRFSCWRIMSKRKARKMRQMVTNKQNLVDFVKQMRDIDISPYIEPKTENSQYCLCVHIENMSMCESSIIKGLFEEIGVRVEKMGDFGYGIYYS